MSAPVYAMAYGLKGFGRSKTMRVRIERMDAQYVWCRTASVADAGTPLVLDRSQIELERDLIEETMSHRDGLVAFG